jgi:bacteriocin biosynthesis cyclodehydratase domain-containing protein
MSDILLFVEGAFGHAVASAMAQRVPNLVTLPLTASRDELETLVVGAQFVAVATWRPYEAACQAVDAACHRHDRMWSRAVLESTILVTGPLIGPTGPCYTCYRKRRASHSATPERDRALDNLYATDAAVGVAGFLPSVATMASASLLLDRKQSPGAAGRMRFHDLINCEVEETRVVRIHGCERCSGTSGPTTDRYVSRLVPAVKELLS